MKPAKRETGKNGIPLPPGTSVTRAGHSDWVRRGECKRCGSCCRGDKLSPELGQGNEYIQEFIRIINSDCPHLEWDSEGKAVCAIYPDRYPQCRDFPAHPGDLALINGTCGFYFVKREPREKSLDNGNTK